jgi:hypothetical protein
VPSWDLEENALMMTGTETGSGSFENMEWGGGDASLISSVHIYIIWVPYWSDQ